MQDEAQGEDRAERPASETLYGKDAREWLERYDAGQTVWTIEMGGLGPGYEQAIQITAAEFVRCLIKNEFATGEWDDDKRKTATELLHAYAHGNEVIRKLSLSGAQAGAAMSVATHLYRNGPAALMLNPGIDPDRRIQFSKTFPTA